MRIMVLGDFPDSSDNPLRCGKSYIEKKLNTEYGIQVCSLKFW